jgi:hypothetical protein
MSDSQQPIQIDTIQIGRQATGAVADGMLPLISSRQHRAYIRQTRREFANLLLGRVRGDSMFRQAALHAADLENGLTLILPGIEAVGPFANTMYNALSNTVPGAVQFFYWGIAFPEGYLPNLMWLRRNRAKAAELAQVILRYQDQYPGRPVHIVANSGGAGPALFAVELLPLDRGIEGIVFLSGAISSRYDLRPALRRLRKGIFNFYSHRDWLVLGVGTTLFGTSDRRPSVSCGYIGFQRPANIPGTDTLYDKLHQMAWTPELISECGHWGTHGCSTSEQYIRRYVAPWITASQRVH